MSRVLILGAAGFLGRHFMAHHVIAGDDVVAVDDMSNPYSHLPMFTDEGIEGAYAFFERDAGGFLMAAGEYDLAYHFASRVEGRVQIEGDPLANADSLRLDAAFFQWAIEHTKVAVYPSSSAVYGVKFQTGYEHLRLRKSFLDVTADVIPAPDELYGWTKLTGEVLASTAEQYGLNTLCIRPFSGYGEDQPPIYPVTAIAERVKRREDPLTIWGTGLQTRDFIHVDDVVRATVTRLEAGVRGYQVMNIGSGTGTAFLALARLMANIAGYKPVVTTDHEKPQGVMSRVADTDVMRRYYTPMVSLEEGLTRVLGA